MFKYFFKSRSESYAWLFPLAIFFGIIIGTLPPFLAYILLIVVNRASGLNDVSVLAIAILCLVYLVLYLVSNVGFKLTSSALYAKIERCLVADMISSSGSEQAPDIENIVELANQLVINYYRLFFSTFIASSCFLFAAIYMVVLNWIGLIPAIVGIAIIMFLGLFFGNRTFKLNRILSESNAALASAVTSLSNVFGSSTYIYSKANYDSLSSASNEHISSKGKINAHEGIIEALNGFISSAVCVVTYIVAIALALDGQINAGEMAAMTALGCTIANPFFNARDILVCRKKNKDLLPKAEKILA